MFSGSIGKTYVRGGAAADGRRQAAARRKVQDVLGKETGTSLRTTSDHVPPLLTHNVGHPETCGSGIPGRVVKTPTAWTPVECITYILDKSRCARRAQWSYRHQLSRRRLAIEQVTGRKFYDLAQERLLTPLCCATRCEHPRDLRASQRPRLRRRVLHRRHVVAQYFVTDLRMVGGGFCCTRAISRGWVQAAVQRQGDPEAAAAGALDGVRRARHHEK